MKKITLALGLFLPGLAFAQGATLDGLIRYANQILGDLVPFAIDLALVVFLFGVVRYVTAGEGEDKAAARNLMIYGIIALFVMVSVWGLVRFIQDSTGITNNSAPPPPNIPGATTGTNGGYGSNLCGPGNPC